jgi:hypothetical protein
MKKLRLKMKIKKKIIKVIKKNKNNFLIMKYTRIRICQIRLKINLQVKYFYLLIVHKNL